MSRFLRSKALRIRLFRRSGGKCELCGEPITYETMQADHKKPYKLTQDTDINDMQALCRACNQRKADGFMDLGKARDGQREAFNTILDRHLAGENETGIILPTGYGKSDVIRMTAFEAWNNDFAPWTLALSPNEYLRDQLVSSKKFAQFVERFQPFPKHRRRLRYAAITGPCTGLTDDYAPNGEFLLSATIQLVLRNLESFCKWIAATIAKTGLRPMVFVDETHTNSQGNEWGRVLRALRDAGAHLVGMTATGFRGDGEIVMPFRTKDISAEDIQIIKTRPGETPDTIWVQLWEGTKTIHELIPDCYRSFKDAWNEGVLCHVNKHTFDIDLREVGVPDAPKRQLSELSASDTRRLLGKILRHPAVIKKGCEMFCSWLNKIRLAAGFAGRELSGIIWCGNDEKDDERVNEHAETIKACLLKIDPTLKVLIATSANDAVGRGPSGKTVLTKYVEENYGDVVIVKQMAGLGLDSPRAKVGLDLSSIRTPNAFVQRVNRVTRPFNGIIVAHWITPADVLSEACFVKFIDSEGGATTKDIEFVDEELKKKDPDKNKMFAFDGLSDADVHDTKDKFASPQLVRRVLDVLDAFPLLLTAYTVPDIAERLSLFAPAPEAAESEEPLEPENTSATIERLKNRCFEDAKQITRLRLARVGKRYSKDPEDQAAYRETIRGVWIEAYGLSNMSPDFDYQGCNQLPLVEAVFAAVQTLLQREMET